MTETAIASVTASVMVYDDATKKWIPSGSSSGLSRIHILLNQPSNSFRLVGRKMKDNEVVVNCSITHLLKYNQASPTFHQWRYQSLIYGLNFSSKDDANGFGESVLNIIDALIKASSSGALLNNGVNNVSSNKLPPGTQPVYGHVAPMVANEYQETNYDMSNTLKRNAPNAQNGWPNGVNDSWKQQQLINASNQVPNMVKPPQVPVNGHQSLQQQQHNYQMQESHMNHLNHSMGQMSMAQGPPQPPNHIGQMVPPNMQGVPSQYQMSHHRSPSGQISSQQMQQLHLQQQQQQQHMQQQMVPPQVPQVQQQPQSLTSPPQNVISQPLMAPQQQQVQSTSVVPIPPPPPPPPPPPGQGMNLTNAPNPPPLPGTLINSNNNMNNGTINKPPTQTNGNGFTAPPQPPPMSNLAAALANAKLKKTAKDSDGKDGDSISNNSNGSNNGANNRMSAGAPGKNFMDEMAKTLARRRALNEQSNDGERENGEKSNRVNGSSPSKDDSSNVARSRNSMDGSSVNGTDHADFERFKNEILLEFKKDLQKVKSEILEAIRMEHNRR